MATADHVSKWNKVENFFKAAPKETVVVIDDVISYGEKVLAIIKEVEELTPGFQADLKQLVDDVKPIAVALAPVIATAGKDPVADFAALAPVTTNVIRLVKDFLSFVPTIEAAYKELVGTVESPSTSGTTEPPAA